MFQPSCPFGAWIQCTLDYTYNVHCGRHVLFTSFWGARGCLWSFAYLTYCDLDICFFFGWFFFMDFVIHNLSDCKAHYGKADGDLVQFISSSTSLAHQCIMLLQLKGKWELKGLKLKRNMCYLLFVEKPKQMMIRYFAMLQ